MGRYSRKIRIIHAAWRRMKWWQEDGVLDGIFQELLYNTYRSGLISIDIVSAGSKTVVAKKVGDL